MIQYVMAADIYVRMFCFFACVLVLHIHIFHHIP